jgi:hypothetical protein
VEAAGAPLELESELEPDFLMPVETDVNWEAAELPEEIAEPPEPPVIPVIEEVVAAPVEPPPQPKPRKPRAPKAGAKSAKRKTPTRRKAKEPAASSE